MQNSLTRAVSAQSFKISCSSGNGFWLVYEDLSIDFPPKSRYGVQTRLRALLEPAIKFTQHVTEVINKLLKTAKWLKSQMARHHANLTNIKPFCHTMSKLTNGKLSLGFQLGINKWLKFDDCVFMHMPDRVYHSIKQL